MNRGQRETAIRVATDRIDELVKLPVSILQHTTQHIAGQVLPGALGQRLQARFLRGRDPDLELGGFHWHRQIVSREHQNVNTAVLTFALLVPPDYIRAAMQHFFITGTGRCGTMALANALNAETGVTCTHEGKFRYGDRPGEQVLPFLTLQNRLAYERPGDAGALFDEARASLPVVAARFGGTHFGDAAYNYVPFLPAISRRFPTARIVVIVRNGLEFVRSATVRAGIDVTPVGWAPPDKALSPVERFVALGRLAPRTGDPLAARWDDMGAVARNAWLWAESNRVLLDSLAAVPDSYALLIRFERFFASPLDGYTALREFLGIDGPLPSEARAVFERPINRRVDPAELTDEELAEFDHFAGPMMARLGYTDR